MKNSRLFDIVCSKCGGSDRVSFEPRPGSDVTCRKCFEPKKKGARRQEGRGGGPRPEKKAPLWKIECVECGEVDWVPFEPRPGSTLKCRQCFSPERDERTRRDSYFKKGRVGRQSKSENHIPRLDHGTRVSFQIECSECGKTDSLDYVPKTKGAIKCRECAGELFGPNWSDLKIEAKEEGERRRAFRESLDDDTEERDPKRLEEFEPHDEFVKVRKS